MNLSPRQSLAVRHLGTDDVTFVAQGAIRSGKTAACSAAFAIHAIDRPGDHVLVGWAEANLLRAVVWQEPFGIMATCRAHGCPARVTSVGGRHVSINGGRSRIWIIGASDSSAVGRLAGNTFRGGMVEEITVLYNVKDMFPMLWGRLSVPPRKLWVTLNPVSPAHWVKRNLIDQPQRYEAKTVKYLMVDNPSVDAKTRESLASGMFGHHKTRLIEGDWAAATGLIYPSVTEGTMPRRVSHWTIGLDWAGSGVFATVLLAHCARTGRTHLAAERSWETRERGWLNESEHAERTYTWFRDTTETHGPGDSATVVFGDPTTPPALQGNLESYGFMWQDGKNDVLPGIREVSSGFGSGALTVDPRCVGIKQEIDEYSWDEKAAEQGEDKPVKANDHFLDSIRYAWFTASPVVQPIRFSP